MSIHFSISSFNRLYMNPLHFSFTIITYLWFGNNFRQNYVNRRKNQYSISKKLRIHTYVYYLRCKLLAFQSYSSLFSSLQLIYVKGCLFCGSHFMEMGPPASPISYFSVLTTVWKSRKFSLILFSQKFRESNIFTKQVTKELISRIFFFSESEFLVFPHCVL